MVYYRFFERCNEIYDVDFPKEIADVLIEYDTVFKGRCFANMVLSKIGVKRVLVHGDYHVANVYFGKDDTIGWFDFSGMGYENPLTDPGLLWLSVPYEVAQANVEDWLILYTKTLNERGKILTLEQAKDLFLIYLV
eukprot:UN23982